MSGMFGGGNVWSNLGQGFWNSADPLNLSGQASSSIWGNAADPLNISGLNPDGMNGPGSGASQGGGSSPSSATGWNGSTGSGGGGAGFTEPSGNLPGYYANNPGFASPSMTGYGYGYYGGQAPIPEGGYYNQMAQSMAGPNYSPVGSSWADLAPGQAWNSPASGFTGSTQGGYGGGGKGGSPYGMGGSPYGAGGGGYGGGGKGGSPYGGSPQQPQPFNPLPNSSADLGGTYRNSSGQLVNYTPGSKGRTPGGGSGPLPTTSTPGVNGGGSGGGTGGFPTSPGFMGPTSYTGPNANGGMQYNHFSNGTIGGLGSGTVGTTLPGEGSPGLWGTAQNPGVPGSGGVSGGGGNGASSNIGGRFSGGYYGPGYASPLGGLMQPGSGTTGDQNPMSPSGPYTAAPQPGQPLSDLGTGQYGQPTSPVSTSPGGNVNTGGGNSGGSTGGGGFGGNGNNWQQQHQLLLQRLGQSTMTPGGMR